MTRNPQNNHEHLIEAYVDGLLEDAEREAVERRIREDADFRAKIELQRSIDNALRRIYVPPSPERLWAKVGATGGLSASVTTIRGSMPDAAPRSRWRTVSRRWAIAAILALGVLGVWRIWSFVHPTPRHDPYAPQPWRSFLTVYQDNLDQGFKPGWVCRTDRQFADTFKNRLGQPLLLLAQRPDHVEVFGLSSCNSVTERTMYLTARVEGQGVIVFVDRASNDPGQSLPPESELHLFQKQLGELTLYELSPLNEPHLLDLFYIPTSP